MTAFNPATDLPSSINTVESLAAWSLFLLSTINPTQSVLEELNRAEFVSLTQIQKAADQSNRLIGRFSLELKDNYVTNNAEKLWMNVKELSGTNIPAGFKSN